MFDNLKQRLAQKHFAGELKKNPIVVAGRAAIMHHWTESPLIKGRHSKEFIDNIAAQMMQRVVGVATSQDPLLANRQEIGGMTVAAANFQVLVLDPPPTPDATGLRGVLGITGELRDQIPAIAKVDTELQEIAHGLPSDAPPGTMYDLCLIRYGQTHAIAHVHAALRFALDDRNPAVERDWFRPFYLCACAAAEQHYRMQISLPATLDPIVTLQCSTMMNIVARGDKYPDLGWERAYGVPVPRLPIRS